MGRHGRTDTRTQMRQAVVAGAIFVAGALSQWLVGFGAERTLNSATETDLIVDTYNGVLGVELDSPAAVTVMIPETYERLKPLPREWTTAAFLPWAKSMVGMPADRIMVSMTVSSGLKKPIAIIGIDAEVVDVKPPIAGLYIAPGGAGSLPARTMTVDLVKTGVSTPVIAASDGPDWDFPLQVGAGSDMELFSVIAEGSDCTCYFDLRLRYLRDGERKTLTVDDGGEPFVISTSNRVRSLYYVDNNQDPSRLRRAEKSPLDLATSALSDSPTRRPRSCPYNCARREL